MNIFAKRRTYTDAEVIVALVNHSKVEEEWFYRECRNYFEKSFSELFFDRSMRQEIFQDSFIRLWTEITDGCIQVREQQVCRMQRNGDFVPMSCSLRTFLMSIAKNTYREVLRDNRIEYVETLFDDQQEGFQIDDDPVSQADDNEEAQLRNRIVAECIGQMSPVCMELLTQFYYEEKSLDEILASRQGNSKDALKTAKNKCMNTLRERVKKQFRRYHLPY